MLEVRFRPYDNHSNTLPLISRYGTQSCPTSSDLHLFVTPKGAVYPGCPPHCAMLYLPGQDAAASPLNFPTAPACPHRVASPLQLRLADSEHP